jgi:glycosyltransferase involved in cell wall biosynthesis
MKKNVKLSIIVPVYNTEKYLGKCLDSLVNQSLSDIEIVCINDGSKDNSLSILKEYKKKYKSKIIIIDKKNEGVWRGRYDGIKKATGEYIGFLDSDDYVHHDFALMLYSNAKRNDSDIAVCGFDRIDLDTGKLYSREMCKKSKYNFSIKENPGYLVMLNGAPWNKIFKRELFDKMHVMKNIPRVVDDMMFQELLYIHADKVSFVNQSLIYYMIRKDSIMNTIKIDLLPSVYKAMVEVRKYYNKENKKMLEFIDTNAFLHLGVSMMYRLSNNKDIDFKKLLKENDKYLKKNFPKYKKSKYIKLHYILTHGGVNFKLWIVKIFYNLGLFRLFLKMYKFMIRKFQIDIKW